MMPRDKAIEKVVIFQVPFHFDDPTEQFIEDWKQVSNWAKSNRHQILISKLNFKFVLWFQNLTLFTIFMLKFGHLNHFKVYDKIYDENDILWEKRKQS